jgi:putative proteasome-type protease
MRSNLSVGMPIDLACYATNDLKLTTHHRFGPGAAYCAALSKEWSDGVRQVFRSLTPVPHASSPISESHPGERYIRFEPAP